MSDQDKRLGVYFHIPFCASKCAYCDFCSLPGRDKLMPYYQDALLIQLQETMPRMTDYFIDTVYFGGGTPSYYGARRIVEILQELKVTNRLMKQSEITVECNPDSVRRKELRMLRKEGVNRLSIGAQSANDDILRLIGRRHNWRQVEMAVKRARKAGFRNVSLDLIYGLPSQTREDWADTLTKALALKPAHISCYGLRLEEGTPMYDEYEGTDILPSDDDQADMYLYAVDFLSRHGFRQYEISNFAPATRAATISSTGGWMTTSASARRRPPTSGCCAIPTPTTSASIFPAFWGTRVLSPKKRSSRRSTARASI